jgi:hypothetical protein
MRESFVDGLSECIYEDGSVVCPFGVSQRLLVPLQGRYAEADVDITPVPNVVTEVCRSLAEEIGERTPSRLELDELAGAALARAEELYGVASPRTRQFVEHLGGFLDLTWPLDELEEPHEPSEPAELP